MPKRMRLKLVPIEIEPVKSFQEAFVNQITITRNLPHYKIEITPIPIPLSKWDLQMP